MYGANVNHVNGEGSSALMAAASRGHADAVYVRDIIVMVMTTGVATVWCRPQH